MHTLEIKQRSPEWHELRKNCITATDFAVLASHHKLSHNLFHKSIKAVIRDKFIVKKHSAFTEHIFNIGHDLEPMVIEQLNLPEPICGEVVLSEDNPNIMASLDARDKLLDLIVEIKTIGDVNNGHINKFDYYKYQVIHQCYTAGVDEGCIAFAYYNDNGSNVDIIDIRTMFVVPKDILSKDDWLAMCDGFLLDLNTFREMKNG